MTEKELNEVFTLLRNAGMSPMLCDTPVPYTEQSVKAGLPSMPGDPSHDEYIMLPKELVGCYPMFFVDVDGDSMQDVGFRPGDRLRVQICDHAEDGDIVIVSMGGECTVKAYLRDEEGRQWLVPRNDRYTPIQLTEDMDARILGKVVEHIRPRPRVSHADLMRSIRACRQSSATPSSTKARAMSVIQKVAPMVKSKSHWYAVYRALVDCGLLGQDMYASFLDMLSQSVPQHDFLPSARLLRRMAVQSFDRPVTKWNLDDAPVSGWRFEEYIRIARAVVMEANRTGRT